MSVDMQVVVESVTLKHDVLRVWALKDIVFEQLYGSWLQINFLKVLCEF